MGRKLGIFGVIGGAIMLVAIFLIRNASDTLNAETTVSKGQEKFKQGKYREAIEMFDQAEELDDSNYKVYFSRAMCYAKLEEHEAAVKGFDISIELSPKTDRATLYFLRGESHLKLEHVDKACEDMKKADQLGQKDAKGYLMYCN